MTTITESKRRDGVMAKGEWRENHHPVSGKRSAVVCCPGCGRICSLFDHEIADDGEVSPSLDCPFDCEFHDHAVLEGWRT